MTAPETPFADICALFEKHEVAYECTEHEPVHTSEDAARVRGESKEQGAKSLLLKANDQFALIVIPGNRKLDMKTVRKLLGAGKARFATPDEVKAVMGCEVGACYPVGTIISIHTYADMVFEEREYISFNPGTHTNTITMRWEDYVAVAHPELVSISIPRE